LLPYELQQFRQRRTAMFRTLSDDNHNSTAGNRHRESHPEMATLMQITTKFSTSTTNRTREQLPTLVGFEVLTMGTTHTGLWCSAISTSNLKTSAACSSEGQVTFYLPKSVTLPRKASFWRFSSRDAG